MMHISSTLIRRIIETSAPERLKERLQDIVLHPDILVDFVRTFRAQEEDWKRRNDSTDKTLSEGEVKFMPLSKRFLCVCERRRCN